MAAPEPAACAAGSSWTQGVAATTLPAAAIHPIAAALQALASRPILARGTALHSSLLPAPLPHLQSAGPLYSHSILLAHPSLLLLSRSVSFTSQQQGQGQQQEQRQQRQEEEEEDVGQQQHQQQQQQQQQQPEAGTEHVDAKQAARRQVFQQRLQQVKEYVSKHGGLPPISYRDSGSGVCLRNWLSELRRKHELGTLPPDMTAALDEAVGDVWRVPFVQIRKFSDMLDRVKTFHKSNGRLPHQEEVDADGVKIGKWVQTQRDKHNAGQLPAERITALEGLPGWTWRYFMIREVDVSLDALMAFQKANDCLPKTTDVWDGWKIGQWVHVQRKAYVRGRLSPEVVASLEAVPGWVWRFHTKRSNKTPFEVGLANLNSFVQAHRRLPKHRDVGGAPDEIHLGVWVGKCRMKKKQGRLTLEQIAALEQVPGWWWEKPS